MESEEQTDLPPIRPVCDAVPMRSASSTELPPHPLDRRWFAHVDGQNYGPYTGHQIKKMIDAGQVVDSDFLCPEGGSAWTQAKNEPLLGALFRVRAQNAQTQASTISENRGTVVQVTNNIPSMAHAALLLQGDAAPKSPGVALLLSLLLCGGGQMYNGQVGKGFLMLFGSFALWFILMGWTIWIWSMIDGYSTAKQMNLRYQQLLLAGLK